MTTVRELSERLADVLGVPREAVELTAGALREAGGGFPMNP